MWRHVFIFTASLSSIPKTFHTFGINVYYSVTHKDKNPRARYSQTPYTSKYLLLRTPAPRRQLPHTSLYLRYDQRPFSFTEVRGVKVRNPRAPHHRHRHRMRSQRVSQSERVRGSKYTNPTGQPRQPNIPSATSGSGLRCSARSRIDWWPRCYYMRVPAMELMLLGCPLPLP